MKREYRGYILDNEWGYVVVTGPDGETWQEDTYDDAMETIDYELDVYRDEEA